MIDTLQIDSGQDLNTAHFNVHGISVQVRTSLPDFAEFVETNYAPFRESPESAKPKSDIIVSFSPSHGEQAFAFQQDLSHAGKDVRFALHQLYWENEFGFRIHLTIRQSGTFEILAYHHDIDREQEQDSLYRNYQRSMRWAIHFPIFVMLRERFGWGIVHGAAIAYRDHALVFCGLAKMGKSTLAAHLCQRHGYKLMSDNFVIVDGDRIRGFPEALRLKPDAASKSGFASNGKTSYGKYHIGSDAVATCLEAKAMAYFFVATSDSLSIESMDANRGWNVVESLNGYLGEFPEQSFYSLLPLAQTGPGRKAKGLGATLNSNVPWHLLRIPHDWDLAAVVERIERCISTYWTA